ncbi:ABC transporter permease [Alkalitalea saponilacus]|uniref:Iron(III) transport system permease protein n=1 Tax=Alkalitalea saponilacus TaxID=889453 RepID=A0A1T5HQM2_9BACT|nr:iron ABC transporter permease [Alkalitalea saponilacus]ASB48436.1 ABC transporter permease [Alkalitalea saponilacus]SKC22942.1 iron(III) transport system permease protein [Alkalitalea saponilacus]
MIEKLKRFSTPIRIRNYFNGWMGISFLVCLAVAFPLMIIFGHLFKTGDASWQHITGNLLPAYTINTLILMGGVAVLVTLIGVSTAWLVSMYKFPGRRVFQWLLVLPIAIPAYILGFTWVGMLDYTSPAYVYLRNNFGFETGQFLFFNILSMPGAIVILSLSFYPYVYLLARTWFMQQSASILEAGYSLGHKPLSVFFRIALPLSRPALVAGVSLALMEVLNDYGLVSYFGVDTFTTGIFSAWFAFGSPVSAIKLSGYLMIFVLILLMAERLHRGDRRYDSVGSQFRPLRQKKLNRLNGFLAMFTVMIPVLLGFILPVAMLIYWSIQTSHLAFDHRFFSLLKNSFLLASLAAVLVIAISVLIGFTVRTFPSRMARFMTRFATIGYAIPGAIIAVGLLVPFIWIDNQLARFTGGTGGIIITGTWFTLVFAYAVRFMAVGYNSIESVMAKTSISLDEASRSLGMSNRNTLFKILIPVIHPGILAGALLVFIDVLKELPLTLILRPFNFDTLAIRAFEFASDERVPEAAPASLVIIIVGLMAVLLLRKTLKKQGYVHHP